MYALPAVFNYVKKMVWGPDVSDHDIHCEKLLEKLVLQEKENVIISNLNDENYLHAFGKVNQYGFKGGFINKQFFNVNIQKPFNLKQGDNVEYLYEKYDNGHINIIKILSIIEDDDKYIENVFTDKKVIVTKVTQRHGREVIGSENGVKFNLDYVKIDFVPTVGDWLELSVLTTSDEENVSPTEEVYKVAEVRALRSMEVKTLLITHWDPSDGIGTIGNSIFFTGDICTTFTPSIGDKVVVDAIESDQGILTWRAVSIVRLDKQLQTYSKPSNNLQDRREISIIGDLNFGKLQIGERKCIDIQVTNNTNHRHTLVRTVFCSNMKTSQIKIIKGPSDARDISPRESVHFTFECNPFFLGYCEESIRFCFKKFIIRKVFKIYVQNDYCEVEEKKYTAEKARYGVNFNKFKETQGRTVVKGIKIARAPPFIKVRIPSYTIPLHLWNLFDTYFQHDSNKSDIIEAGLPVITKQLEFSNYCERFHLLVYLDEIAQIVGLRSFDMERAFLLPEGEFLSLEVKGLNEGRPSLIIGDCVKVRDPHDSKSPIFEGYIHEIGNNKIYAKFSNLFHNAYKGEDLSVHFTTSRTSLVHSHYAVDLVVKHLGEEILFPERIVTNEPSIQITDSEEDPTSEKAKRIEWFNTSLNEVQKCAIKNAMLNVARPLPYVIFGPPGTGKTVTLVETILQIWKMMPESRILAVTPSNSSANLLAERLIYYSNMTPGTLVRIVAFHIMRSNSISDQLKPYCASVDISEQNQLQQLDEFDKKFVSRANLGRHRITVITCTAAGKLFHLGFPKGHFTHIIMDEAGQASEPECMIPLSFMDKTSGQIILAGDPQQLGPVVLSPHALQYGLDESYLGRLLQTFPYRRDVNCFKGKFDGYNPSLITKLLYNYRTIPKILALPSNLYYNGTLISNIRVEEEWVQSIISKVAMDTTTNISEPGMVFYGIRGVNVRGDDHPSWYNPHEGSMLTLFVNKLYEHGISADDIGIISPYIQQNKFIRTLLSDLELEIPKVGTVEEFQGQEKKIILASTVRSNENYNNEKTTSQQIIGFLRNPKRLNVLLTRAQVLLVIFGNPYTLSIHEDWSRVIQYSLDHGKYIGCNVPSHLNTKEKIEIPPDNIEVDEEN